MSTQESTPAEPTWFKSSYSNANGGNCIEIAHHNDTVIMRDSRAPDTGMLTFDCTTWHRFINYVESGTISQKRMVP